MSNETSRVEAAAAALEARAENDDWEWCLGDATTSLAAADAHDHANGIRRVWVGAMEAVQEQVNLMYAAAKQGENLFGENAASDHLRRFADNIGTVLAAAANVTP